MKLVVLDGYTENPGDLSWAALEVLGELTVYDRTSYTESPLIAERIGDSLFDIVERHNGLFTAHAGNEHAGTCLYIARTKLKTERNALHLVLGILPAGGVIAVVELYAEFIRKAVAQSRCRLKHAFLVLCYGNDGDLYRRNGRRQDEPVIVAVAHDDSAYHTRGGAP